MNKPMYGILLTVIMGFTSVAFGQEEAVMPKFRAKWLNTEQIEEIQGAFSKITNGELNYKNGIGFVGPVDKPTEFPKYQVFQHLLKEKYIQTTPSHNTVIVDGGIIWDIPSVGTGAINLGKFIENNKDSIESVPYPNDLRLLGGRAGVSNLRNNIPYLVNHFDTFSVKFGGDNWVPGLFDKDGKLYKNSIATYAASRVIMNTHVDGEGNIVANGKENVILIPHDSPVAIKLRPAVSTFNKNKRFALKPDSVERDTRKIGLNAKTRKALKGLQDRNLTLDSADKNDADVLVVKEELLDNPRFKLQNGQIAFDGKVFTDVDAKLIRSVMGTTHLPMPDRDVRSTTPTAKSPKATPKPVEHNTTPSSKDKR